MVPQHSMRFALVVSAATLGVFLVATLGAQEGPPPKQAAGGPKIPGPVEQKAIAKKGKKKTTGDGTDVLKVVREFAITDPVHKMRGGSWHAHDVKMAPGKTYVIRMFDQGSGMDPHLFLEDSAGKYLADDDDGEGNLNSRIEFNPPYEGKYRIIATTHGGARSGKYLLTVEACPLGKVPPRSGSGFVPTPITANPITAGLPVKVDDLEIRSVAWGQAVNPGTNVETHGYFEYRFLVENRSDTRSHRVALTAPSARNRGGRGFVVHRLHNSVDVRPGESAQVSVFQPDVPLGWANEADLEIDGRLADRRVPVGFPQGRGTRASSGRGVVSGGPSFATVSLLATPSAYGAFIFQQAKLAAAGSPMQLQVQQGFDDLSQWSTHWMGYSSFDGVMVHGPKLQAAPAEVRAALWQFVECGGTLLVLGDGSLPESWRHSAWDVPGFDAYYPGFGQCLTARESFERWTPEQWQALHEMWYSAQAPWHQIVSPNEANRTLTIVADLSIPVRGLFVVMILFVILIGPINVYWLGRAKRRIWLLWTVPICAFATCALLVVYMIASEGWNGHVRSTSITVLDENAQRAATIGWIGYYCPTMPSGGLHFSRDTELTPHVNHRHGSRGNTGQPVSIDWTNGQHLTDGWLTAKVPAHFMVRRGERRLERLNVRAEPDGALAAVNGLGADVKELWLVRSDGAILSGKDIGAGATAPLTPTGQKCPDHVGTMSEVFGLNWVQQADALAKNPIDYLRPGCYVAVIDDAPFMEQGLQRTQSRKHHSVVFGIMK